MERMLEVIRSESWPRRAKREKEGREGNEEKTAKIRKKQCPDVGEHRCDFDCLCGLRLFGLFGWRLFGVRRDCLLEKTSTNGSNSAFRIHETALRAS